MFNVVFAALILLDVANCSQASWKIDKFATWRQSTVFDMSPIQTIYWEREREREIIYWKRERGRGGERKRDISCVGISWLLVARMCKMFCKNDPKSRDRMLHVWFTSEDSRQEQLNWRLRIQIHI
jgi:hypothetical protein